MSNAPLEAARAFRARGWYVVPVQGKRVVLKGWPALRLGADDLPRYFQNGAGVGLLLGEPSGGLVDVDLDSDEARALAAELLPPTAMRHGRASSPGAHWWYRCTDAPPAKTLKHTDPADRGAVLAELRTTGAQTVVPPSMHPSGEPLQWEAEGDPASVTTAELAQAVQRLAAAALCVRYWPAAGMRQDSALALSGGLVRAGWDVEEVEAFCRAVLVAVGDDEIDKRLVAVRDTARKLHKDADAVVTGWPRLGELLPAPVAQQVRRWVATAPDVSEVEAEGRLAEDFHYCAPTHTFVDRRSGSHWSGAAVDARVRDRKRPSVWLKRHRGVDGLTWAPGEDEVVHDRLLDEGGWVPTPGYRTLNLYRPPVALPGDPVQATPWLELLERLVPEAAERLAWTRWMASRVQRPNVKINHALVLVGPPGCGKDTALHPLKQVVGPQNVADDLSPVRLMERFNAHLRSVLCHVGEARDLGETSRYQLYEHLKPLAADPPTVLRVDEKFRPIYTVPNVTGLIVTSNHPDALYIPADDRRMLVLGIEAPPAEPAFWRALWAWYASGGVGHVGAYLRAVSLEGWDPKAPPMKTAAWQAMVDLGRAPEGSDLGEVLEGMGRPAAVTVSGVVGQLRDSLGDTAAPELLGLLTERRHARRVPHLFSEVDYTLVRNPGSKDGRYRIAGRYETIYAQAALPRSDRLAAALRLATAVREPTAGDVVALEDDSALEWRR